MNWISAKLRFASVEGIEALFSRYSFPASGDHLIDGLPVALIANPADESASIVCRDNAASSDTPRFRCLTLWDELQPILNLKTEDGEPDSYDFDLCWPEALIADLSADPKPDWLAGVQIVDTQTQ